jgi:hypothetical protein
MIKAIEAGPTGHAQLVGIATQALQAELTSRDRQIAAMERRIAILESKLR